ncbi:MAG: hypothetical protein NTV80_07280 [Verrucomicrobia bacterium]|nr:hypothetical protein [Verrucomicrobiota bacterium]
MSKPNKYQKQLSEAVEATRNELLDGLRDAQAKLTTALSTRDHAAHDKWSAYKEMGRNEQVLAVASRIEAMAARTQLLAGNLTQFANDSHTDSEQAQTAMAEAAAAIKNAASAMELLTEAVHAEAAVTKSRDKGEDVNSDAIAATAAVETAMTAVDDLQTQSLTCSIIAATPLAGSVAQAFSVLGDQVGNLVIDTTQARDVARQEVAATTTLRNQTWKRFYKTIEPFERPLQTQTGLLKSFAEIDKLANFGLTVQVSNQLLAKGDHASVDQQGLSAGLLAQVALPVSTVDFYQEPVFYAVKELEAATFNFASGSTGVVSTTVPTAGGRGVWGRLSPQIAPDVTVPATSEVIHQTVKELVTKAGQNTNEVLRLVTAIVQQNSKAVADAQTAMDNQMKALEQAKTNLAAGQADEKTKADALRAAQQKETAAAAAVETVRNDPEEGDKKSKSLPKVLKALADAEAETAGAALALTVAQGITTVFADALVSMEMTSAQTTTDLITAGAGRWEAALQALATATAAFKTAPTVTDAAKTAAETALEAEKTATLAAAKAAAAFQALSAGTGTGNTGELQLELNAANLASDSAAKESVKVGLAAARAIALLAQAAVNAETAAKAAGTEVRQAESAAAAEKSASSSSDWEKLLTAVQEMETAAQCVPALTQKINADAQAERQLETVAGVYRAQLLKDNKDAPLSFGTTYCIFMRQDLKKKIPESPLAQLPRLSLPSQPILATYSLQELIKPTVLRLSYGTSAGPTDPLLVAFTLPAPPPKGVSYRMIIIPKKLWEPRKEDEQYLIERASPSDYVELDFGPPAAESPQSIHTSKIPQFGYYSDMSGDVINLNNDQYLIGVLAWQDNQDGPYIGSLVGKSDPFGTPTPYFYGSGPADDPTAAATSAPAAATTPAA